MIEDTGARQSTEELIGRLLDSSLAALNSAPLDPLATEVLTGLAYAATRRSF